jgi:hypothetical protein
MYVIELINTWRKILVSVLQLCQVWRERGVEVQRGGSAILCGHIPATLHHVSARPNQAAATGVILRVCDVPAAQDQCGLV